MFLVEIRLCVFVLQKPRLYYVHSSALDKLQQYPFPGNVRELQYTIERAIIMSDAEMIEAMRLERIIANDRWQSCLIRDRQGGEWTGKQLLLKSTAS